MSLCLLPYELLHLIVLLLDRLRDINALARTNQALYANLNGYLYSHDVKKHGCSALFWAAREGQESTAEKSLQAGADVNIQGRRGNVTPLIRAIQYNQPGIIQLLLRVDGLELEARDEIGGTALATAADFGREEVVELLLAKGADKECRDTYAQTPLISAASRGRERVVNVLLARGAAINSKDKHGETPLSWAAKYGRIPTIECLLEQKATVDAPDNSGRTPLSWAAMNGHAGAVKLLLDAGASPSSMSEIGWTPIFWAAFYAQAAVVRLLLEAGVDPSVEDRHGVTPAHLATNATVNSERSNEVVELLSKKRVHRGSLHAMVGRFLHRNSAA